MKGLDFASIKPQDTGDDELQEKEDEENEDENDESESVDEEGEGEGNAETGTLEGAPDKLNGPKPDIEKQAITVPKVGKDARLVRGY